MDKIAVKKVRQQRRRLRIKKRINATTERPRLCISRSNKYLYAQIIDDTSSKTLVGISTHSKNFTGLKNGVNINAAKELGKAVAGLAAEKGIKKVIFDRNGYLYHGKIKAFAEAAREAGLEF